MKTWTSPERRARDQILSAMLPPLPGQPGFEPAAVELFWPELESHAPPLLRWGLRAAVWVVWASALARGRCLGSLSPPQRAELVQALGDSALYPLRQVALVLKLVLCFAHFQRPDVRRAAEAR
ncbi:MAG TPA: hypothetical protein QGF58_11515 [Myxococcota bacterium]|nr:hypothetical protein [Myxococcota bacterium]